MVDTQTEIGSSEDRVAIELGGKRVPYYLNYTVKRSVMTQPSTFSASLGAGVPGKEQLQARDLLTMAQKGTEFKMFIGPTLVQCGIIEDHDIEDGSGGTVLTIAGRDWLAPLTKNCIHYETDFGNPTYYELTRKILDLCGLKDRKLTPDNEANRIRISRYTKATSKPMTNVVEVTPTNTLTTANSKIQLERVVGKIGQTWFDFLRTQYKKVGFFLWATGDGEFVLSRPTGTHDPIYQILKKRGLPRNMSQAITRRFSDHTSQRHAYSNCFGKGGHGARKQHHMEGSQEDTEMIRLGFTDRIVSYDEDAKTADDAEYLARRKLGEDRRDGFNLTYTVSGHTVPSLDESRMLIWTPDTTVNIVDEPLGDLFVYDNSDFATGQDCYIESVEFKRNPATTTTLRVMRKQDLYFLGEKSEFEDPATRPIHGVG